MKNMLTAVVQSIAIVAAVALPVRAEHLPTVTQSDVVVCDSDRVYLSWAQSGDPSGCYMMRAGTRVDVVSLSEGWWVVEPLAPLGDVWPDMVVFPETMNALTVEQMEALSPR